MDGIKATRRVKAELPEICIIGLSMHNDAPIGARMREVGADAFICKTVSAAELIVVISDTVGECPWAAQTSIPPQFADLHRREPPLFEAPELIAP